jgi:general secretion pathway protein L
MNVRMAVSAWITTLAELFTEWQLAVQARRSVVVSDQGDHFMIHGPSHLSSHAIVKLPAGERIARETPEALRDHLIIFELASEYVVTRHLTLPLKAREFIAGIVLHQIDRLSPWPPAQAIYAIDVKTHAQDAGMLDVAVLIASQSRVEEASEALALAGLPPQRIAARPDGEPSAALMTLWSATSQVSRHSSYTLPQMIGAGLATMVLLSVVTSAWALYTTDKILSDRESKAALMTDLAKKGRGSDDWKDLKALNPLQRAWAYKERSVPTVAVLAALTHAIPDSAYLTELRLEKGTLRLIGFASDAPSLIAPLEQSDQFSGVHFFAPSTKAQRDGLYRFFVETHVAKNLAASGD